MNHLNSPHDFKNIIISTFQEILAEDPNFFLTDRLSVLTWKSKKIKGALITKVGNIRYLGFQRKDKAGQEYWKYKPLTKVEGVTNQTEPTSSTPEIKPENQPNSKESEITVSAEQISAQSVEESEQVKKFREKYGNPNQKSAEK